VLARFGVIVDVLQTLYNYAWFVGFGAAAITYLVLMNATPPGKSAVEKAGIVNINEPAV
jgi:cytosine/uracil/thiamine/allantoin permease